MDICLAWRVPRCSPSSVDLLVCVDPAEALRRPNAVGLGQRGADPVMALKSLFHVFKVIQIAVLLGWCVWFAEAWIPWPTAPLPIMLLGLVLIAFGQVLNFGVMMRLGSEGVFYGNRFGRNVAWQTGFPFSLVAHPQYVGALLSVWGFMLAMRFPNADWIVLPLVSTVYYALGARLES